jgi:DNA-directed RNA polymerase specialized sigma24 family protein
MMSDDKGSVSGWVSQLQAGDTAAAQRLWERYFRRMVGLARTRLSAAGIAGEEEDVALSAFASFCEAAGQARFPQLANREDLWRLLVLLTARKVWHRRRLEQTQKRGGGISRSEDFELEVDEIVGREPTPEFAALVAEELQARLAGLGKADLVAIALRKLDGYTNDEIAAQLGCARRTVERRLRLIRLQWGEESPT